jgi:integrase
MARRGSGEGGIFQRESDGRWVATVELGKGSNGKRLRKVVYGSTKREVQAKLKAAQDAGGTGRPGQGHRHHGRRHDRFCMARPVVGRP